MENPTLSMSSDHQLRMGSERVDNYGLIRRRCVSGELVGCAKIWRGSMSRGRQPATGPQLGSEVCRDIRYGRTGRTVSHNFPLVLRIRSFQALSMCYARMVDRLTIWVSRHVRYGGTGKASHNFPLVLRIRSFQYLHVLCVCGK